MQKATDLVESAKPDPTKQVSESWVAADRIEIGRGLEELQDIRLLLVSLLEPVEGLFVVAEAKVSIHKCTRGNVAFLAASFHFREEPECIAAPTGVGVGCRLVSGGRPVGCGKFEEYLPFLGGGIDRCEFHCYLARRCEIVPPGNRSVGLHFSETGVCVCKC